MRVVHMFDVDFDHIKQGTVYSSLCGNRYIAEAAPTKEEIAEIEQRTRDNPVCKRCLRKRERRGK